MYSLKFFISLVIFAFTIILVTKRPFKLGIGYSAVIGAFATISLGIVGLSQIIEVWNIVWNATFTFIAIIMLSLIYDEVGFFEYAAIKIAELAHGSGIKLFVFMILLGSVISAFFANDGAVLVLTPIVYSLLRRTGANEKTFLAFIMAIGFISDTASMPFTISNLVNIIMSSYFRIDFLSYMERMIIPDLISVVASLSVLLLVYRRSIPGTLTANFASMETDAIKDRAIVRSAVPTLIALVVVYSITGLMGIPVAFIAVPAVALLLIVVSFRKTIDTKKIIREAPWQIVLFSLGMYIIIVGMGNAGLILDISNLLLAIQTLPEPVSLLLSGYLFAFLASIMNNLPAVMLGNLSIQAGPNLHILAYANVIANDIGPKFTPIGSLATLLWIYTLDRKKGLKISYGYYMKIGFILAFPVLTLSLLGLWMSYLL